MCRLGLVSSEVIIQECYIQTPLPTKEKRKEPYVYASLGTRNSVRVSKIELRIQLELIIVVADVPRRPMTAPKPMI